MNDETAESKPLHSRFAVQVPFVFELVTTSVALLGGGVVGALTLTCFDVVFVADALSVTVRLTVYVPAAPKLCVGDCAEDVAPSPKLQLHALMLPSLSVLPSVKLQARSVHEYVNAAVGG